MRSFTPVSLNWDKKHYDFALLSIDLGQGWRSLLRIVVFFGEGFTFHVLWNWNWSVQMPFLTMLKTVVKKAGSGLARVWYFLQWIGVKLSVYCQRLRVGFVNFKRCLRWARIKWKRWWLHLDLLLKDQRYDQDPFDFWNRDLFPMIVFGVLLLGYMLSAAHVWAPTMAVRAKPMIAIEELKQAYSELPPQLPAELQALVDAREAKRQQWLDYLEAQDEQLQRIPQHYQIMIAQHTYEKGVPLEIVVNLIQRESEWYPTARSRPNTNGSRDEGLMQLNTLSQPYLIEHYYTGSQEFDVFNPRHNVEVGIGFLAGLYREFGNWTQSVMAYNCGSSRVHRNEVPESTKAYAKVVLGDYLNRI